MTSKCGFEFFCACVIHPVAPMFHEISAKWRKSGEDYDESDLWDLYKQCKTFKADKMNAEEHIKAALKVMINDVTLTAEQDKTVAALVKSGWAAFIAESPVHYCGEEECDGECGVQQCGVCIDCCRCWRDDERRWR
jgi:hypothetical protein